ncbi:hypothetical protein C8R46DRAFT_1106329 [Mycena filopes]|nr:hypothetical protein C8R46DRAFT_1106329 [Mycena filopes]
MIVEGGSRVPLYEARLSSFLIEVAQYYLRQDVGPHGELESLIIWLFCLGVSRDDISSQNPEVRSTLVGLLRPFVSTSVPPSVTSPPPPPAVAFDPQDPPDEGLMRYNLRICSPHLPPPSDAAIVLIFALKEVVLQIPYHIPATRAIAMTENRTGPTAEDYAAFQRAITPLFSDARGTTRSPSVTTPAFESMPPDPWISGLLAPASPTTQVGPGQLAGSLAGIWEGSMMISSVSLGNSVEGFTTPSDFLCRTPMQCELSEYFCFTPCAPLTLDGHTPARDLPANFELSPETYAYARFNAGDDSQHEPWPSRPILDHTLQEHEDAWAAGGFDFSGRVDDDGSIVLLRRPKNDDSDVSEKWIFRGRLRYGTALVGTFQSSVEGLCGVHGIFSLSKRTASASTMQ